MAGKSTPTFNIDTPDRDAIASHLGLPSTAPAVPAALSSPAATFTEPTPPVLVQESVQLPAREEKEPLAQLNVRVRASLQKRLRDYCYRHNVSQSEVIEFLLGQALSEHSENSLRQA